ncbi:MAG TPA: flagellar hook-associated protein FlgK [Burkholderiaceae bacterium]|nr:flagellar hook-associated protein FlgK [Burkholderiaceae bacterium]
MSIINNGLSGALAAQLGLDTTSHNVANVMTPGFTRQGVLLAAVLPASGGTAAGAGVRVPALQRFSDEYKSLQLWRANSKLGQHEPSQPYLTQIEQVMGDDASSINTGMQQFFAALNAASVDPTSSPLRQAVVTSASGLAQRFNSLQQVLTNQRNSVYQQRSDIVAHVNLVLQQIARLNGQISATNATGVNSSGLIDSRDQKIDELAGLVGVQVVNQPDGSRSVALPDGQPLVVGAGASSLSIQTNANGTQSLQLTFASETFSLAGRSVGGQLGALDDFERGTLAPMALSISDLAVAVADKINTHLAAGYTMDGRSGPPLFVANPASASALLTVSSGFLGSDLAFSSDAAQPGNSDNLLAVIDSKNQPVSIASLGSVLLGDSYTQLVAVIGNASAKNQSDLKTAQTVRDQALENWKSTSGVNSDEEAMNLMQFQQMYQANMKVVAIANQLFDSTLAMMS